MNKPDKDVSAINSITYTDAVEFFSKRTTLPCPACGHAKWAVASPVGSVFDENEDITFGLVGVKTSNAAVLSAGFPLISAVCQKCYFVRSHALKDIVNWVAQGKQEFIDGE